MQMTRLNQGCIGNHCIWIVSLRLTMCGVGILGFSSFPIVVFYIFLFILLLNSLFLRVCSSHSCFLSSLLMKSSYSSTKKKKKKIGFLVNDIEKIIVYHHYEERSMN